MAKQTVSLQPGETKAVAFTFVPTEAKSYTVQVGDITGSFIASPIPVVDIRVTNLTITPASCYVGDAVTMNVEVKNFGNAAGSYDVILNVA